MRKYIVTILLLFFILFAAESQDALKIVSFDYTNYPSIQNKLFIFDNNGQPVTNLNASNFSIRDNGVALTKIKSITCTNNQIFDSTSLTVVFDLGLNNTYHKPSNFSLGQQIANRIINLSDSLRTEIALTSYDYRSFLNRDLSYNYSKILNEISSLKAKQGSLWDAAFLQEPAGCLKISSRSKHPKSIILITDGGGKLNFNDINTKILESGVKLFVISLRKKVPDLLMQISKNSGGWSFSLDDASQINPIVYSVLSMSKGYEPCTLDWEMDYSCIDSHFVEILFPSKNIRDNFKFVFNNFEKSFLISDPQFLGFSSVEVGSKKQLSITVSARNRDIFIKELNVKPPFKIVAGNVTDYLLKKDQFIEITIEYVPEQKAIVFSQLEIVSDACRTMPIYMTGGFPNTKPTEKTVRIVYPNGGEYLIIGDTSFVQWLGLLPKDVIQLEYSTDNGRTWKPLSTNVTGLSKDWIVPETPSDSCLVKIIQLWPNNVGLTLDLKHNADVNTAFFNPAGDLVLTASSDTTAVVWIANTGVKKFTLKGHHKPVHWAVFDPLDEYIATSSHDSTIIIWSQIDGSIIKVIDNFPSKVESINFSPSGKYLVSSDFKGFSVIFDRNWNEIQRIKANEFGPAWYAEFNPKNEDIILSANGDGQAKEWNWKNYTPGSKPSKVYSTESILCSHATYNVDATKIAATTSSGNPKKLYVWSTTDDTKSNFKLSDTLYSVSHNIDTSDNNSINFSSFFFHPDLGKEVLLTTSTDETARLWDASDGTAARINDFITDNIFREHRNSVTTAVFDRFGSRLLTASWDSTAKIWNLNQKELQQDISDSVFSIAYAKGTGISIDMGTVYLGELKDSIIPAVFINESNFAYNILSYKFSGTNSDDFELLTDLEFPLKIDRLDSLPFEVRFNPKATGFRTAELEFELPAGLVVKSTISGLCDLPALKLNYPLVDFGSVEVGAYRDSLIALVMTNVSGTGIIVDSIRMVGSYRNEFTSTQALSKNLNDGESIPFTFRLTPDHLGRKNAQFEVFYKGKGSPRLVNLFGEGIEGRNDSMMIYLKNIEAFPGDIIKVPIYVGSVGVLGISDFIEGFTTNMRFNSTLLEPLSGFIKSEINGDERILTINFPKVIPNDSIIHTLEFKALWGNDTLSPLILEYTVPRGSGRISITENSAIFKLKGICIQDGKPRLFLPGNGIVKLGQSAPNPANNMITLQFSVVEYGNTNIKIYDMMGNELKEIINENLPKGDHSIRIDITDLPAGIYYYVMRTYSDTFYNSFIIKR